MAAILDIGKLDFSASPEGEDSQYKWLNTLLYLQLGYREKKLCQSEEWLN